MTMISAIASSSRCAAPTCIKSSHSASSPSALKVHQRKKSIEEERRHSFEIDAGKRFDVDGAKHISEKDREVFLSYGLFNIVAGKRTAELLEKQHRHEGDDKSESRSRRGSHTFRRVSEPDITHHSTKLDFLAPPPMKDHNATGKSKTGSENSKHLDVKHGSSEKRSLKRVAKTTSRNLQEFFKKF